ncbi:glycoside hydrolase family 3 C-terminal domain-containing protein [Pseudomonas putida]|uniref:glycoside hydrolase family 3 protein n=1 Tax=Pseudomonas putida TaxID=303 RepID=UPI002270773B|nr:glycoside hydrolase family 3 C-terminal domain-containing protein [Pseudomonas putida]WAB98053.1 glycoside hydrolase family 3 C-terminal domain-containing protein [Pseudomonas putida]
MRNEVHTLPLEQKALLTAGRDMWSTCERDELGLASVRMADGPMGLTGGRVDERDVALLTPCGLALAASWDAELVTRVGQVVGDEAQRIGVQAVLAPNLNLMRSPLAGRAFELFGEDPQLIAELGWAWAQGVQSRGVASVIKHLVCNDSETDRRNMNAVVAQEALRDVYFKPFEHAARSGAWAMLTGYNKVNGVRCAEHGQLLLDWLKRELHWDGLVMSDWFGTHDGAASLNNGLDLEMPGPGRVLGNALLGNEQASAVDFARLDDAVERLLRLARRTNPARTWQADKQAQRLAVLEEAAAAGMVLLRNESQVLPYGSAKPGLLAVIGPNATVPCYQGGTFAKVALAPDTTTPLQALQEQFSTAGYTVAHAEGAPVEHRIPPLSALSLVTPAGEPGMAVDYYSTQGIVASQEVRYSSSLIWFKQMPGVGELLSLEGEGRVEVSTSFVASRSGEYTFLLGGTGAAELYLNGHPLGAFDGRAVEGDIMGKLMQAPHDEFACRLEQGQTVQLRVSMQVGRSLAHGLWFGCRQPAQNNLLDEAVALASRADEVVLLVGETPDAGLESVDRESTLLPAGQIELIRRVCEVNRRVVVVLNVAHPVDMTCMQDAAAILVAWYPGQEFGPALSSVLKGDREPGGRLPVTFARQESDYPVWSLAPSENGDLTYHEGWWVGYRSFSARDVSPAFSFGYGMGYARFACSLAGLTGSTVDALQVELVIRNLASRKGKEVIQLYVVEPQQSAEPTRTSLKAFAAVHLQPDEQQSVRLALGRDAFSRWSSDAGASLIVPGRYHLMIGHALDDAIISVALEVSEGGDIRFI